MHVDVKKDVPSDIDISQSAQIQPVTEIARNAGIDEKYIIPYGNYKAKIDISLCDALKSRPNGKYVLVTAITPTPLGEGKTVTTVGLSQSLKYIDKPVFTCIRQPSMGPTFGIKGGAAGGGYAQVIPMEEFNLHLTGDIHAISAAHNLMAAAIDARRLHESRHADGEMFDLLIRKDAFTSSQKKRLAKLGIDAKKKPSGLTDKEKQRFAFLDIEDNSINFNRVVDINDSSLRYTVIGLGGNLDGRTRQAQYDIAVASELMAILALTTNYRDLRDRLGRIIFANSRNKEPLTAEDLGVAGAMAVIMKDTLHPTLMQTLNGSPVFIHAGPFANIAHGNSSIIADKMALKLVPDGYVVTEAGFGADCGMEKFMNIKCRYSGLRPDCVVVVATVRALKMHGGGDAVSPGKPLPDCYRTENTELVKKGVANLVFHIKNVLKYGVPVVVAINRFADDTENEIDIVKNAALDAGAVDACISEVFSKGDAGGAALAEAVVTACEEPSDFTFLYPLDMPVDEKIETIGHEMYNAGRVGIYPEVMRLIDYYTDLGYGDLPICMAKTHLSISHNPSLKGVPDDYRLPVKDIRLSAGAGFLYPLCGDMRTMPGLPSRPAFMDVELDPDTGRVLGLF